MTDVGVEFGPSATRSGSSAPRRGWLRRMLRQPSAVVGLILLTLVMIVSIFADVIAPGQVYARANPLLSPPSRAHLMGTDNFQRDMYTLVIHGVRVSMTVVVIVVAVSSLIGVSLGLMAGYLGGFIDDVVIRTAELLQSVPRFFLALLVIALYGPGLWKIILVLCLTSWPLLARVVRAESLSLQRSAFVEAARASGASRSRILRRNVLPNVLPQAIVVIVLMGSRVILIEAGLAFLGVSDPNAISLGVLARTAQQFLREAWWLSVFPGLAIVAIVLGMNLVSDGLAQALNPRAAARAESIRRAGSA